jgi:molybdopterin adenylyltransferase
VIPDDQRVPPGTRALVLTVSDGVAAGTRRDESGDVVRDRLNHLGFMTDRATVPDDRAKIVDALRGATATHALVVSTGGTGLTPRDVTPQATASVLDYDVPGLAEAMRASGRRNTPMADLSRGLVGVVGQTLVVNVPGSPRAALESLEALEPTLRHALETLAGPFDHTRDAADRPDLPNPELGEEAGMGFTPSTTTDVGADWQPPAATASQSPASSSGGDPWRDLPEPDSHDESA